MTANTQVPSSCSPPSWHFPVSLLAGKTSSIVWGNQSVSPSLTNAHDIIMLMMMTARGAVFVVVVASKTGGSFPSSIRGTRPRNLPIYRRSLNKCLTTLNLKCGTIFVCQFSIYLFIHLPLALNLLAGWLWPEQLQKSHPRSLLLLARVAGPTIQRRCCSLWTDAINDGHYVK